MLKNRCVVNIFLSQNVRGLRDAYVAGQLGRGVLLGILGGGVVPPGSPNPDPVSDQKNVIFHTRYQTRPIKSIPVFRPGLSAEIMSSLVRLERKQKIFSNAFRIRI